MAYQALYRRYRPRRFSDLTGQDHITIPLRNQVKSRRIAHAYLFSGTRGTGKTSAAKIFARAINCKAPVDGEPCGQCDLCLSNAEEGVDIIEIDAASNNGVDEIRDLREKVRFSPIESQYKVYIVDEVHMLTSGAFNALLKTLEEPPEHAVFILATTEPQKLPATILSRCQRYEFYRISVDNIVSRLKIVLDDAGYKMDERALRVIAHAAQGGLRDALSLTDQCIAFCGEEMDYDSVISVLGMIDEGFLFEIVDALIDKDAAKSLHEVDRVVTLGKDLGILCKEIITHLRNLMLLLACSGDARSLLEVTDENYYLLSDQSKRCSIKMLIESIDVLNRTSGEMKYHSYPRAALESSLVKICHTEFFGSMNSISDRLTELEKYCKSGRFEVPTESGSTPTQSEINSYPHDKRVRKDSAKKVESVSKAVDISTNSKEADELFSALVSRQPDSIKSMFEAFDFAVKLRGNVLEIVPPPGFLPTLLEKLSKQSQDLAKSISDLRNDLSIVFTPSGLHTITPASATAKSPIKQAAADIFGSNKIEDKA